MYFAKYSSDGLDGFEADGTESRQIPNCSVAADIPTMKKLYDFSFVNKKPFLV